MTAPANPARAASQGSRRPGRGTLLVIGSMFVVSAILRVGEGFGQAFAAGSELAVEARPEGCPSPPAEISEVLAALKLRDDALAAREQKAADLEQNIALARIAIDKRLAELEAAEGRLSDTIAIADSAAAEDVSKLVAMYEAMKPKEAARLFEEMDPEFAAGFLAKMRADAAAAVLAGVDPAKAYTISVVLAGRNANAPTN